MSNIWVEASLNAQAYFMAYRALCRARIQCARAMQWAISSEEETISCVLSGKDYSRQFAVWEKSEKYWKEKLKEAEQREKEYRVGV